WLEVSRSGGMVVSYDFVLLSYDFAFLSYGGRVVSYGLQFLSYVCIFSGGFPLNSAVHSIGKQSAAGGLPSGRRVPPDQTVVCRLTHLGGVVSYDFGSLSYSFAFLSYGLRVVSYGLCFLSYIFILLVAFTKTIPQ